MARHYIRAAKPKPAKPRAEIRAAPSFYERTHPVGSAERFLDDAAKEALAAAAAGGVITPRRAVLGAVRAVAKEAGKYPDPLFAEAAKLPKDELLRRAARAEAFQKAMDVQNKIVAAAAAVDSPVGRMATALAAADVADMRKTVKDVAPGFNMEFFRDMPDNVLAEAMNKLPAIAPPLGGATATSRETDQEEKEKDKGTRQDTNGGDASPSASEETPAAPDTETPPESAENAPAGESGGPRIVINPTTFRNSKDALCVAFNEGFRLWMEATGFDPQSEPTAAQRRFFSDTAYADDELQLRRTILARIATFDTSVKDPTDDQLAETASFLNAVLESDWCRNEWERNSVRKLADAVQAAVGAEPVEPRAEPVEPRAESPLEPR